MDRRRWEHEQKVLEYEKKQREAREAYEEGVKEDNERRKLEQAKREAQSEEQRKEYEEKLRLQDERRKEDDQKR